MPSPLSSPASSGAIQKPSRLLLVQGAESQRSQLADELRADGYEVWVCQSALDAFHQFYKLLPDMVLAEYGLPILNGFQLCRCLKNDPVARYVPYVLLGQPESHIERYWSYKVGLDGFLDITIPIADMTHELRNIDSIYTKLRRQLGRQRMDGLLEDEVNGNCPGNAASEAEQSQGRLLQLMDQSIIETTIMREFREMSTLASQPELLNHLVFSLMESVLNYDIAALYFGQNNREQAKIYFHQSQGRQYDSASLEALKQHFCLQLSHHWQYQNLNFEEMQWEGINGTHPSLMTAAPVKEVPQESFRYKSVYFDRFEEADQLYGSFALYSAQNMDYAHIFPVTLVSQELHNLMKLQSLYRKRDMQHILDGVSQTYNFSYFQNQLEKETIRAQRHELEFCLALIDIDHFESFNREYGFAAGDELLRSLANQCSQLFRRSDIIARCLDSSLGVIFTSINMEQAQLACERLRDAMKTTPLIFNDRKLTCTISIGLAAFDYRQPISTTALYKQALEGLRQAKQQGRNRIVVLQH